MMGQEPAVNSTSRVVQHTTTSATDVDCPDWSNLQQECQLFKWDRAGLQHEFRDAWYSCRYLLSLVMSHTFNALWVPATSNWCSLCLGMQQSQ
jgi:hypothetical protein